MGFGNFDITTFLILIPAVLLALMVHELAHGWVAYKLGDPTAKYAGRLTINPLKHVDPLGLICMVLFRVGWAKPVPVNMRNLKHPKRDMAIVASAGPLSNLLFGLVCVLLYYALMLYASDIAFLSALATFIAVMASLNVTFAIFNLLPLPPLDGSRIAGLFLPSRWYYFLMQYERYIQIAVLLLLWLGVFSYPLSYANSVVIGWMEGLARWIFL